MQFSRDIHNIYKTTPSNELIPHHADFKKFFNKVPLLKHTITKTNALIAGGWPMAVLLGERSYTGKLDTSLFGDYDIYPQNKNSAQGILDCLRSSQVNKAFGPIREYASNNASTFRCPNDLIIQVILKPEAIGTPKHILSHFDFVNCAIGYHPVTDTVYFHKDLVNCHLKGELQILNPWMLNIQNADINSIVCQITRFQKYVSRWNYTLSKTTVEKIIETYNLKPHLDILRTRSYEIGSGNLPTTFLHTQNVWAYIKPALQASPYWEDHMDQHGYITKTETTNQRERPLW
jgi:hypothetical protein